METTNNGSEDNRKDFVHHDHLNERENEKGGGERKKRRGRGSEMSEDEEMARERAR